MKEALAGVNVGDLVRKHGISEHTFYRWKAKYGGMEVSDARRLKQLEDENRRLKSLARVTSRRAAVGFVMDLFCMSQRRSCTLVGIDRTSCRHVTRRLPD